MKKTNTFSLITDCLSPTGKEDKILKKLMKWHNNSDDRLKSFVSHPDFGNCIHNFEYSDFIEALIENNINKVSFHYNYPLLIYLWRNKAYSLIDKVIDRSYNNGIVTHLKGELCLNCFDMIKFHENDNRIKFDYIKIAKVYFSRKNNLEIDKVDYLIEHIDVNQMSDHEYGFVHSVLDCPEVLELIINKKPSLLKLKSLELTGFLYRLLLNKKSLNILKNHFDFENILDVFINKHKHRIPTEHMVESFNNLDKSKIIKLFTIVLSEVLDDEYVDA